MEIVLFLIVALICGAISKSIGGRSNDFWWGFLLGIIGIVVVGVRGK